MGQPWDEVENTMTMAMLEAYRGYFARHPPTHLLVAAYMGYKPAAKPAQIAPDLPDTED